MTLRPEMRNGFCWMLAPILILAIFSAGCADEEEAETPEIAGSYTDQYGDTHQISRDSWTILSTSGNSIVWLQIVNNGSNFTVGRNDTTVSFNPGKYSRLDWTFFNNDIFMCTTVFNGIKIEDAKDGEMDATDPTTGGCNVENDFSWTNLTP